MIMPNNFMQEIDNLIQKYGEILVLRHEEDNNYQDIIVKGWSHNLSPLIGTKKFQQLFTLGLESNSIKNFFILKKYIPEGFKVYKEDLVLTLDKEEYQKGNIKIIGKHIITYKTEGIVFGSYQYLQLHCDEYRFSEESRL